MHVEKHGILPSELWGWCFDSPKKNFEGGWSSFSFHFNGVESILSGTCQIGCKGGIQL